MKYLLEVFLKYFEFLYLDPQYSITRSSTSGSPLTGAQLIITGNTLSWSVTNDRGQISLAAAPTAAIAPENWFRLSIIRRYLDGTVAAGGTISAEDLDWLKANMAGVEALFADAAKTQRSCKELITLENMVADELFGPPKSP